MGDCTLAIAVALLVPDEVLASASFLNAHLSPTLRFDSSHLPHITLVQQFLTGGNRSHADAVLATIVAGFEPIMIRVTGVRAQPFDDTQVVYWDIERSEALKALHNRVSGAFAPLACSGNAESFFNGENRPIRASTITYVEEFRRNCAGDKFEPHLTLGFGEPDLHQAPFSFMATRVAVCHLGELNTCRRVLYERQL